MIYNKVRECSTKDSQLEATEVIFTTINKTLLRSKFLFSQTQIVINDNN